MLSRIILVYNDDEDNYKYTDFNLGDNFYRNIWGPIQNNYTCAEDLELSPEQERALCLFEYINDNI